VVFVMSATGVPEPRVITIALNDWDNTQVVSGLEEGEEVTTIGAAQLQAAQAEQLARMRDRMGGSGPFPGGGGGRGR
jgi:HlyD family secretion protein